jgi:RNA polymerase sigma-70 factor (ECF subfamily)
LLGDLSLEEIARVTRVPVGTVKSRLFHGLRRLRVLLADVEPGR